MIVRWLVSFILSISLSLPALVLIVLSVKEINLATIFSLVIGFVGMVVLIISTLQLSVFNHKRDHQYAINNRGLWKVSRHPNYWGEMMFWWGIFLIMLSLDGSKWLLILGPLMLFCSTSIIGFPNWKKNGLNTTRNILYTNRKPIYCFRLPNRIIIKLNRSARNALFSFLISIWPRVFGQDFNQSVGLVAWDPDFDLDDMTECFVYDLVGRKNLFDIVDKTVGKGYL